MCTSSEGSGDVCTRADASVHWLIKDSLHTNSNEQTHLFTKRPFSYEKLWLFSQFSLWHLTEAYNKSAKVFWYLSHMRKVANLTCMDIYTVGLDASILV